MNGVEFELGTQFGMAGDAFAIADIIWLNGKLYQMNMYEIDMEVDKIEDFINTMANRDMHYEEGCDCGCNSKK
jgi:hypothetical protein